MTAPSFLPIKDHSHFVVLFFDIQHAKKVVSDSLGLVNFAIWLVNSVFNLPDGQEIFFEGFKSQKNYEINSALQKASGAS